MKRQRERGSALLVVLVFAAIIAIALYRSVPNALFEARRQREQVLIDHGHEYARAIQLYYRRNRGMFPPNMDALVNTNGLRFLRRKYADPFTGKNDWRLIHGQGGMLVDSKVSVLTAPVDAKGTAATTGSTGTGTNSGASTPVSSGSPAAANAAPAPGDVVVAPVKERAAQNPTTGTSTDPNAVPSSSDLAQDPSVPLLPTQNKDAAAKPATAGAQNASAQGAGTSQFGQSNGVVAGGSGIAGVASVAHGKSIKKVNDQDDYSLWEFVYDPRKDTGAGGSGTGGATAPVLPGQAGAQNGAKGQNGTATTAPVQPANSDPNAAPIPNAQGGNIDPNTQLNVPPQTPAGSGPNSQTPNPQQPPTQ